MTTLDQIYKNILIYAVTAVLLVGIVIACVGIVPLYRNYRVHAEEQLLQALAARIVSIEQSLARAADISLQITSRTLIRDYLEKYNRKEITLNQLADFTNPKFEDSLVFLENVKGINRFDLEGNLVSQVGLVMPQEYIVAAVDHEQLVSFSVSVLFHNEYLIATAPIWDRENRKVGTDVVVFNTTPIQQILQNQDGLGSTGTISLAMGLDSDIQPLFQAEGASTNAKEVLPADSLLRSAFMAAIHGKQGLFKPKGESEVVIAYGPVNQTNWGIVVSMTAKEMYEPATNILVFLGGLSAVLIIVAVFGTIFVIRPLTFRLKHEFAARKKSEKKLQFFKTLVDQTQDAIFIVSPDTGRFIEANEQASASLGYTHEGLLDMKVSDIDTALPDTKSFRLLEEKIKKHGTMFFDGEHRRKDGSCFPVEVNIKHAILKGSEYIIAAVRDVTDKLQARRHVNDLVKIVENSLNEVYIFDAATFLFLMANGGARKNLGYSMEELHQLTPIDIKPEYTLDSFKALVQPLVSGVIQKLEFYTFHKRKDGSTYPVEIHLQVSTYAESQVFVAIILDITERKRSEDELQKYRGNLKELVKERTEKLAARTEDLEKSQKALQYLLEDMNRAKKELETKLTEIERMNRLFVDRELRMKELKEQIRELEQKKNTTGKNPE